MRKELIVITLLISIMLFLKVLEIYIKNELFDVGINAQELESRAAEIKKENVGLKEEYLRVTSLQFIDDKAKKDGFIQATNYIYL